jgi:ABC-type polysaccharide/polyol phosphate transport system ATPase subunit
MNGADGIAIRVSSLSKMFKIYARPADMFWELCTGKPRYKPFWALKNVSLEVGRGQVVGIMGRNGAGKSTLLKIITGTLDYTAGGVAVQGRVSSILELGTGFHSEYSGRENIYLGGLMVGLSREEILDKMDWIIRFSELEDFIDQPFKTYSTGMQARLTFSTAVCVDPDILIIDEALSVGDAKFQRKSFGKIEEFRNVGRTILLVSHDSNTISTFCDHAVLLEGGQIADQGEPQRISKVYYKMLFASDAGEKRVTSITAPAVEEALEGESEIILDAGKIKHEGGHAWWIDLTGHAVHSDSSENPQRSRFVLYEDDKPLRPAHYTHDLIRKHGRGGYSHWEKALLFSTSDNSDPRSNGRVYSLRREVVRPISQPSPGMIQDPDRETLRRRALDRLGRSQPMELSSPRLARMGNGKAEILESGILDEDGNPAVILTSGAHCTLFMRVLYYEDVEGTVFGFVIRDRKGVDMFGTSTRLQKSTIRKQYKGDLVEAAMKVTMWLTNEIYFLTSAAADPYAEDNVQYDLQYDGLQFEVGRNNEIFTTSIVDLNAQPIEERLLASSRADFQAGLQPEK